MGRGAGWLRTAEKESRCRCVDEGCMLPQPLRVYQRDDTTFARSCGCVGLDWDRRRAHRRRRRRCGSGWRTQHRSAIHCLMLASTLALCSLGHGGAHDSTATVPRRQVEVMGRSRWWDERWARRMRASEGPTRPLTVVSDGRARADCAAVGGPSGQPHSSPAVDR